MALALTLPSAALAQAQRRVAVLQAEDRRAPTAADLATIRTAARSSNAVTARIALRALGRLERASLVVDIVPGLSHRLPEVRAEAANALAQALQGEPDATKLRTAVLSAQTTLTARLDADTEPSVRAALCDAIARLPYTSTEDVERAEAVLVAFADRAVSNDDRLGLARGLEALARRQDSVHRLGPAAIEVLSHLAVPAPGRSSADVLRDARVRRLALEALDELDAVDGDTTQKAATDPDAQVRRLAMRAAATQSARTVLERGLHDDEPMVRIEALRGWRVVDAGALCRFAIVATTDTDMHVVSTAVDQLALCGADEAALRYLEGALQDPADATAPRNWHRAAHALVSLAAAAPAEVSGKIATYAASPVWQVRVAAARAAGMVKNREVLERLARDAHDNVVEAALEALTTVADHSGDGLAIEALRRSGEHVVRAAALALERSPHEQAVEALTSAQERLAPSNAPGAVDALEAIRAALVSLGVRVGPARWRPLTPAPLTVADLERLAAPRARFSIRDVGEFEVALLTTEAPATVLRFAQLASDAYYNGLTFHRIVPNGVVQGGSPGANEYSSAATMMRDEVELWPHVRGAVGISTRGRDTGDAQIFIDLVDNPRYDHRYTVFAQVLTGMEIVDRLLEGDVIDRIEILP